MIDTLKELADKAVNTDLAPLLAPAKFLVWAYVVGQAIAIVLVVVISIFMLRDFWRHRDTNDPPRDERG